jgi:hypothetical protein
MLFELFTKTPSFLEGNYVKDFQKELLEYVLKYSDFQSEALELTYSHERGKQDDDASN